MTKIPAGRACPAQVDSMKRIPPPLLFAASLLLGIALNILRPLSLGLTSLATQLAVALPLLLTAAVCGLSALETLRRAGTPNAPFATPTALLTTGPFRVSRNPMYVSHLLILGSLAAFLDSAWLLVFIPIHGALLNRFVIPGEEARLEQAFGSAWVQYSQQVRRWL